MREMKNSGIDWIGLIPKDWSVCKVKDIFFRKNEKANNPEPVVLSLARSGVKVRDITNGEGQLAENYSNYNPVSINDLLLNPMDLYSGANCSISKVEGVISPAYINLKAIGNNNSRYYDYYFKTQYWGMTLFAHGKGVSFDNRWTLNAETLMNYYLPLPTTREQEKIANFLDEKISEIDNAINKTKETIEDYKKLKQSIITKIVTEGLDDSFKCQKTRLKNVAIIVRGGSPRPIDRFLTDSNDGVNWIKIGDTVKGNKYIDKTSQKIIKEGVKNSRYLTAGDLILTNSMSFGEPYILNIDGCIHDGWVAFSQLKGIKKEYLYYFLISDFCKKQFDEQVAGGVVQNLNVEKISKTIIYLPIMQEQIRIVEYLDKKSNEIDKLIAAKEKIVEELESYKKSVIYEYVTGKKEVK